MKATPTTMESIIIQGKKVSYWTNNLSSKVTILMLHGFRGNHSGLMDLAQTLPGARIIILDLPGYGQSAPLRSEHNFNAYARFINAFCQVIGLPPVVVIGHSFGASLGIVFAAKYPARVKKLILVAPVTSGNTFEGKLGQAYYRLALVLPSILRTRWIKSRIIDYLTEMILLKSDDREKRNEISMANKKNLSALNEKVVIENFLSFYSINLYGLAGKIAVPTLIVFGEADKISPSTSMLRLNETIKHSQIQIIPHAGHLVPLEQPDTVGTIVSNFLKLT